VGASIFPDDTEDPYKLISYAEAALETAKDYGRNTYILYSPKEHVEIKDDYTLLSRIGDAAKIMNLFYIINRKYLLNQTRLLAQKH